MDIEQKMPTEEEIIVMIDNFMKYSGLHVVDSDTPARMLTHPDGKKKNFILSFDFYR